LLPTKVGKKAETGKGKLRPVRQIWKAAFRPAQTRWGSAPQSRQLFHSTKIFWTENKELKQLIKTMEDGYRLMKQIEKL